MDEPTRVPDKPFIRRLVIENYRSIKYADVPLGKLTFLVGRNGSGKSNVVDALRFVADALWGTLQSALTGRGNLASLYYLPPGLASDPSFALRLEFALPDGRQGHYAFRIGKLNPSLIRAGVVKEQCFIAAPGSGGEPDHFMVQQGELVAGLPSGGPAPSSDRLYLSIASGIPAFRDCFDMLSRMVVYNPVLDKFKTPSSDSDVPILNRDGSNLASILEGMEALGGDSLEIVLGYLQHITPGISAINIERLQEHITFSLYETHGPGGRRITPFQASDGTLRALAVLVAIFQPDLQGVTVPLVGVEEPETGIHPAAAGVLREALQHASARRQIIVTSQSAELLDDKDVNIDSILAVTQEEGASYVGRVDEVTRSILRDRLFTAGELLLQKQLLPDLSGPAAVSLFDEVQPV